MVRKTYPYRFFWIMEWIYSDNHLCLFRNIYVITNQVSLISCSLGPKLIYYYLGLRRTSQTLYWVQRGFDCCCCWGVLLGPPSLHQLFEFGSNGFLQIFWPLWNLLLSTVPFFIRFHRFDIPRTHVYGNGRSPLSRWRFFASRGFCRTSVDFIPILQEIHLLRSVSVVSLLGVVLIARPTAIFGSASHSVPVVAVTESQLTTNPEEKGTQTERLIAVGYVITSISKFKLKNTL